MYSEYIYIYIYIFSYVFPKTPETSPLGCPALKKEKNRKEPSAETHLSCQIFSLSLFFFFFVCCLFRAAPAAYMEVPRLGV